jgi:hypothetical protein
MKSSRVCLRGNSGGIFWIPVPQVVSLQVVYLWVIYPAAAYFSLASFSIKIFFMTTTRNSQFLFFS